MRISQRSTPQGLDVLPFPQTPQTAENTPMSHQYMVVSEAGGPSHRCCEGLNTHCTSPPA